MTTADMPQPATTRSPSSRDIAVFLAVTFGITWTIGGAAVLAPDWMLAHFGPITNSAPLFYLAVWAPDIAALSVTFLTGGPAAVRELLKHLFRWRVAPWVWLVALGFYPVLMLVVELVGLAFGDPWPDATGGHWPLAS